MGTKLKHFIDERKHQKNNRVAPFNKNSVKLPISFIDMRVIRRKVRSTGDDIGLQNNSEQQEDTTPSVQKNTTIYNKNLIEVFHISFISAVIVMSLAKASMTEKINAQGNVKDLSRHLLFVLDVAPVTLVSILLPILIIARQPEMQKWIKTFFKKQ